ncbi:MAG: hypothetical protein ABSC23_01860 [Bryobacteraceae bacterium]|jgi:hypothetical protein
MNAIRAAVRRFLRGPAVSRMLAKLGIDARRYWLLMDLFGELSDRHEMLNQLGRDDMTLRVVAVLYFIVTGLGSILFLMAQPRLAIYFVASLALPAFFLFGILISETGNSIVNPVEGLVLAHHPVTGATYTAAKLSHLLRIVLYLVSGMNIAPALAGLALKGARWYYPILHMLAAFAVGLTIALLCCAVFGWLVRFVPPARLKSAAQTAELTPWVVILILVRLRTYLAHMRVSQWLPAGTGARAGLAAALVTAAAFIVVFGLRALSADYLIRVSTIVHGGSRRARVRSRRPRISDIVAWLGGGPASRAGFEYLSQMMLRDWQFRRQMIMLAPIVIMPVVALVSGRLRVDPFSRQLTMVHALPHIAGVALFRICAALPFGGDYKASWIFLVVPSSAFGKFARGVYARLWLAVIAIPHAVLLVALAWFWGIPDAALFIAYSAAAASAYLSLELRLIAGIPFTKPPGTSQGAYQMPLIILGMIGMVVAVAVQDFLLFRSRATVLAATIAIGAATWIVTRISLGAFERTIRFHLGLLAAESGDFYKEMD